MKKRLCCMLLVLVLAATLLPAALPLTARAAETGEVTRSQWVQQLVATFEMTVDEENCPDNYFSDLTGEEEYYRDILVAVEFGVVDLEAGLPFRPTEPATRDFAAQTLNFCLNFVLGEDVVYSFSDSAEVPHAHDAQVAVNRGWLSLVDGAFKPQRAITKAEMDAMLADAKSILEQTEIDVEHENSFVFTDEVKVLENAAAQINADGTLTVASTEAINQGELFAVYFDGVPFVYRAEAVSSNNGAYTVTVTQLEAGEYLVSVDAEGTATGDLADFEVAEGLEAIYLTNEGNEYSDPRMVRATEHIEEIHIKKKIDGVTVTVDLTNMVLDWRVKGVNPKTMDAMVKVTGHTFVTGSVAFGAKLSDAVGGKGIVLGTYPIGALGNVSVIADVELDGSITISYGANFQAGVAYNDGQFRLLKPQFHKTHFSITAEVTLNVYVTAKAEISNIPLVYAGCSATVGMKANAVAKYRPSETPTRCLHLDGWIYAYLDAHLRLGTKKLNLEWKKHVDVWTRNNSPVRSVTHFEDGCEVPKCTYGETDFVKEHGHNTYYYSGDYNGGVSKYKSGGVADVVKTPVYKYDTDKNGNATITGFNGGFGSIAIPNTIDGHTVVAIGEQAFKGHTDLRNVTLPANVETIESSAFADCTGLRTIILSEKLTVIQPYAFVNCKSLVTVEIPDSVTEIGINAFKDCRSLSKVKLSNNLKTIGEGAFYNCSALPEITIPKSLEKVSQYQYMDNYGTFYKCTNLKTVNLEDGITAIPHALFLGAASIETIDIPDSVTTIEGFAFAKCASLSKIKFSVNLTNIDGGAFSECTALKTLDIPDSVTEIGIHAFKDCTALVSVKLSNNLKTIGEGAFYNCSALPEITIPKSLEKVSQYQYMDNYGTFYKCTDLKTVNLEDGITAIPHALFLGAASIETINIPDSVTTIEGFAFAECASLSKIKFSVNLTKIDGGAFSKCTALKTLDIPDSVTEIGIHAFKDCTALVSVKLSNNLKSIGEGAFYNCSALPEITIPKSLEKVSQYQYMDNYGTFYKCTGLKTVKFQEGISGIPAYLFLGCPGFESITIPETITKIGSGTFSQCTALKTIIIPESVTEFGSAVFSGSTALTTAKLPSHWTKLPAYSFKNCTALKSVELSDVLKTIGKSAFNNCDALTEFKCPTALTTVEEMAFYDCSTLETIIFNNELTTINSSAFHNCDALKDITITNKVETIQCSAFEDCDALTTVTLGSGVKTIGYNCFYDCDALTAVTMGDAVTEMGHHAFYHCDNLKNVTLSRNLTSIPSSAFYECVELEEITIPYYVTEIADNAFNSSPKLTKVVIPRNVETIKTSAFSYPDRTVIYGVPGTYAETWANDNGYKFVSNEISATAAALDAAELTMNRSATKQLTLTITPAESTDVISWKTSNDKVVTVDEKGLIKAVGVGEATVKVTVGSASASVKITVIQPATSIGLNKTKLTLDGGSTYQLKATVRPDNAVDKAYTWSSSAPEIASVDETGLVTAHAKGTAEITVTMTNSGITNTCAVTVSNTQTAPETVDGMESPHDYALNCTDSWKYSIPNAEMLAVTFDEKTELEDGFDFLIICGADGKEVGKYTGKQLAGQTITVPGDTVVIKLSTDDAGAAWGFKVTGIEATHEHKFGKWSRSTEPTCTEAGADTRSCECGEIETRAVDPTGHTEVTDKAKSPGCTESGLTEGKHCKVCNAVLIKQETIPAAGHKEVVQPEIPATCTTVGQTEGSTCEVCGEVLKGSKPIPVIAHSFGEWEQTVAPTCAAAGTEARSCTACKHTETRELEILDHTYSDGKCTVCGGADPDYKPESDVLRGDMDNDGDVDSDDAIYLLRHTILSAKYPITQSGDVDGDGDTDSDDAIYLLRHTILPSKYPLK